MIKIKNHERVEPYEFDFDNFVNKNLNGMVLHRALLQRQNLSGSSFVKTILRGAELDGADFSNANMAECSLAVIFGFGTNFSNAKITNAILVGARCNNANFQNADLSNSHIASADFSNANLCGADFSTCIDINEANFEGALYNSKTKWPNGFDPKQKGAIKN